MLTEVAHDLIPSHVADALVRRRKTRSASIADFRSFRSLPIKPPAVPMDLRSLKKSDKSHASDAPPVMPSPPEAASFDFSGVSVCPSPMITRLSEDGIVAYSHDNVTILFAGEACSSGGSSFSLMLLF